MHKIKQIPEDFIVKEVIDLKFNTKGKYSYYKLTKKDYTTVKATETIAHKLNIKQKYINFAGTKDKKAVTEQYISIQNSPKKDLKLKDIELKYLGKGDERLNLGSLTGNNFIITLRNLDKKDIINLFKKVIKKESLEIINNKIINNEKSINKEIKKIILPNYFGEQRFSKNNHLVGKSIIKKDFESAVKLILENKGEYEDKVKDYLNKNKNDYIGALRQINKKILQIYIHSYQSYLWNKTIEKLINKEFNIINNNYNIFLENNSLNTNNENENNKTNAFSFIKRKSSAKRKAKETKNIKIPIIGFGIEIENKEIKSIIEGMLKKENINHRDFIIKEIPELSSEGAERDLFIQINDFKINNIDKDDLNKNKSKAVISFSLSKGSYATVVIKELLKQTT